MRDVKEMADAFRKAADDSGGEIVLPKLPWDCPPNSQLRFLPTPEDNDDCYFYGMPIIDPREARCRGPIDRFVSDSGCGCSDKFEIRAPKSRFQTNVQEVERVWVRPKVPSKLAGRRGSRRAWKRANPPHWTLAAVGKIKMAFFDPSIFRLTE
jgi:hypothetical protein